MPDAAAPGPVATRDAATIMLVRDSTEGGAPALEVCMVRRHLDSDFVGGAYVFPGGKVDEADRSEASARACAGRDDAGASDLLDVESGGLAFWVAAARECFEEAGVLLAYQAGAGPDPEAGGATGAGSVPVDLAAPGRRRRLAALRAELNAGRVGFLDMLAGEDLVVAADRILYFSHWITPEGAPKRYDTRFFVAALPAGQVPVHDEHETVDTVWVRPGDALERAAAGEFDVIFPTMKNLQALARFSTSDDLLGATMAIERVPTVLPRVVADDRGVRILLPGDPGYDEAMGGAAPAGDRSISAAEVGAAVRRIDVEGRMRE